jgi:hypothetical protein
MTDSTQFETRAQAYSSVILPLARQEKSMLYDRVFVKSDFTGKSFYQDQIGNWSMSAKTSVNADTPENDPNLGRTRIDIATYNDARLLDRSLKLQELSDPLSMTSVCIQSAVGIKIDEVIYGALGGVAYRGETGATAVSFPSSQQIAADYENSGTNTGLTVAKLRHAAKMLDAAGVPAGDRTIVAGATEKEQLLGSTQATSADYNNVRALVSGDIDTFLGFKFVWLPDGIVKVSSNIASCYAFHKTGLCFGMLEELFLRIAEREDKSYSKQVYYEISCGAGRLEEKKVVEIKCDESVVVA